MMLLVRRNLGQFAGAFWAFLGSASDLGNETSDLVQLFDSSDWIDGFHQRYIEILIDSLEPLRISS